MGTATRKANKAMRIRVTLGELSLGTGPEASAARKAHKALDNRWDKRYNSGTTSFHAPNGRQVMKAKATRNYRVA